LLEDSADSRIHPEESRSGRDLADERPAVVPRVDLHATRPRHHRQEGVRILKSCASSIGSMTKSDVSLNIAEIRKPEIDAKLVGQGEAAHENAQRHRQLVTVGDGSG
jgi:ribosomal protein S3